MKKKGKFLLLLVMIFLLTGCGKAPQEESGYTVYYVDTAGTRLMESNYVPSAQTFDELMDELIEMMQQPPTTGFVSALQGNVSVEGYERGIDALRIDFSKEYYDLGNTEEVLLRAAVVKTFSQIPGVTKVMITVEKEQLCDAQGQPVPAMDADSFIDTKEGGINSYLYAKLALYFSNEDGTQLVREARNLHYSSNMVLERVVIEQLIEGPSEGGKAVRRNQRRSRAFRSRRESVQSILTARQTKSRLRVWLTQGQHSMRSWTPSVRHVMRLPVSDLKLRARAM